MFCYWFIFFLSYGAFIYGFQTGAFGDILVKYPHTIVGTLPFSISLLFPMSGPDNHRTWNGEYFYKIVATHVSSSKTTIISSGVLTCPAHNERISYDVSSVRDADLSSPSLNPYKLVLGGLSINSFPNGNIKLSFRLSSSPIQDEPQFKSSDSSYSFYDEGFVFRIPAWLSIFPSILTIIIAITLKQSLLAIFVGTWLGTSLLYAYNPFVGFIRTLDTTLIRGISTPDHASVLLFCLFIGGMIGVLGVGGGANGLAQLLKKFARTRRRAALSTYFVGILTFFDDYASCLISGLTMKDITGVLKISREKLSFIADTCAANISTLSIVSSWICIEISYIVQEFTQLGMETDGYGTFIRALPYNFYPISMLLFCLIGILLNRDFGPMLWAERRAHRTGQLIRPGGIPAGGDSEGASFLTPKRGIHSRWWNGAIPFIVVISVVIYSMIGDGAISLFRYRDALTVKMQLAHLNNLSNLENSLRQSITDLDDSIGLNAFVAASVPFNGLLWASIFASLVAIILVISQKILSLSEAMEAWINGAKSMLFAVLILIMAWGLGDVCKQLKAAEWISSMVGTSISPGFFPTIVFITASAVSFSTGSAWGTMSILFPLMIQMGYSLHLVNNPNTDPAVSICLLATIASILGGAVWGNQSSPIADSCIMSSVASGSDHNDHVYTQLAYTIPVGLISIIFCNIPVSCGLYPWPVGYIICCILFILLFYYIGGQSDADDDSKDPYLLHLISLKYKEKPDKNVNPEDHPPFGNFMLPVSTC